MLTDALEKGGLQDRRQKLIVRVQDHTLGLVYAFGRTLVKRFEYAHRLNVFVKSRFVNSQL